MFVIFQIGFKSAKIAGVFIFGSLLHCIVCDSLLLLLDRNREKFSVLERGDLFMLIAL